MRKNSLKKLVAVLGITLVLVGVFGVPTHFVFAKCEGLDVNKLSQRDQDVITSAGGLDKLSDLACDRLKEKVAVTSDTGKGSGGGITGFITGITAQPLLGIWYTLMYIVSMILSWILNIVAFFLNNIFYYAIILNPNNMPAVVEGWIYLRDIANGLFILIVLWIALVIIFDIESSKLGDKKLLFRVMVVALLINFSLALVSVVFGIANQLSLPFYNKIASANNGDLAGLIIDHTKMQTIFQTVSKNATASAKNVKLSIDAKNGCGFSALAPKLQNGKGCVGGDSQAGAFAEDFVNSFTAGANFVFNTLNYTISLAVGILLLSMIIGAFIGISAILLTRIIYMVFLGITAPAAFICLVIPGGATQGIWNMWIKKLICWAFVAPAFYFLFYMSLRILVIMTSAPIATVTRGVSVVGDLLNFIPFIVFLGFLFASMKVGKWMGCTALGDVGLEWGKKLARAGVVGTGQLVKTGVSLAASAALGPAGIGGRVAGVVAGAARGAATRGGLGSIIAGPALRAAGARIMQQKTQVKTEKEIAENSLDDAIANLRAPHIVPNAGRTVGTAKALAEKKRLNLLTDQEQRNALSLAQGMGEDKDLLIANPYLSLSIDKNRPITEATNTSGFDALIEKHIKPSDMQNVDFMAIGHERSEPEQDILRQKFLASLVKHGTDNHFKEFSKSLMGMKRGDRNKVLQSWNSVLQTQQVWEEARHNDPVMYDNYIRYIAGKAGRPILGRDLPEFMRRDAEDIGVIKRQGPAASGSNQGDQGGSSGTQQNNPPADEGNQEPPAQQTQSLLRPIGFIQPDQGNQSKQPSTQQTAPPLTSTVELPIEDVEEEDEEAGETEEPQARLPQQANTQANTGILGQLERELKQTRIQETNLNKQIISQEDRLKSKYGDLNSSEISIDEKKYLDNLSRQYRDTMRKHNSLEEQIGSLGGGGKTGGTVSTPFHVPRKSALTTIAVETALTQLRNAIQSQEQHIYKKYGDNSVIIPHHEQELLRKLYARYDSLLSEYDKQWKNSLI